MSLRGLLVVSVVGVLLLGCGRQAPLEDRPCPCAEGYVCCAQNRCVAGSVCGSNALAVKDDAGKPGTQSDATVGPSDAGKPGAQSDAASAPTDVTTVKRDVAPADAGSVQPGAAADAIDVAMAESDAAVDGDAGAIGPTLPEVFPDRPNGVVDQVPANSVARASLLAYWPFDEGQGTFLWDVSGNNNDGVLLPNTSWRPAGFPAALFANAHHLQFDGVEAYVEFRPVTLPAVAQPKTISLWARYDSTPDPLRAQALMALLNRPKAAGLRIEFRDGRLAATSYFYKEMVGTPAPPIGWHHIVYTYNGASHILYVDGKSVATSKVATDSGAVSSVDGRVRIGRSSPAVDDAFRGLIDDVRIFDRPLDANEVRLLSLGSP